MNRTEKRRHQKIEKKSNKEETHPDKYNFSINSALEEAVKLHSAGNIQQAKTIYQKIIQVDPNQADALHLLGVIHHQTGEPESAANLIKKAISIKLKFAAAHNNLGNVLMVLKQSEEALKHFQQAVLIEPNFFDAHNNIGNLLCGLEKFEVAISYYKTALAINPNNPQAYNNLGNALSEIGNLNEAIGNFNKALEIQPNNFETMNNLGNAQKKMGLLDDAAKTFKKSLLIHSGEPNTHNNLGNVLHDLNNLDEAIHSYNNALTLQPDFVEALNNLGNALIMIGKQKKARRIFKKILSIDPSFIPAYNNLGSLLQDMGETEAAISIFEKAIKINPKDHNSRHMLSSLKEENTDKAPAKYISSLFDGYAGTFEDQLVKKLGYKIPFLIKPIICELIPDGFKFKNVIDLGCGTGLSGVEFRDMCEKLTGVDLSNRMIQEATKKQIYDYLFTEEMDVILKTSSEPFDLIIASDVLVYLGDLNSIFENIKKSSQTGALFVFSTEHTDTSNFSLQKSGRYNHSKEYIVKVATSHKFKLEHFSKTNLRKHKSTWIKGGIYAFRKIALTNAN